MMDQETRVELVTHPNRLIVRIHEELPRDPERPYFVQTRPVDRLYVPLAVDEEQAK